MKEDGKGRTALVLYGTETGNAQELAEEVGRTVERLRFSTTVLDLDHASIAFINQCTLTVFVVSTTGQGEFPSNSRLFWASLLRKKLAPDLFHTVHFAVVGLGDSSYPRFNWAARKLDKRLIQLGAWPIIESCEGDEQAEDGIDGSFLAWLPLLREALLGKFSLPNGPELIREDESLPSKWLLEKNDLGTEGETQNPGLGILGASARDGCLQTDELNLDGPDHDSRPIHRSFHVTLDENRRVTPSSHWQDVRLLSLSTSQQDVDYFPGDALSIQPKNFPEDVRTLIQLMDWDSVADSLVMFRPNSAHGNSKHHPSYPLSPILPSDDSRPLSLRHLLMNYLDITAIPRRSHLTRLAQFASDPVQKERLLEFTQPTYLDEYYDYATRPRRSILEVLQEFDSVKVPWSEAANVLPILRPRSFSIASGGILKKVPPVTNEDTRVGGGTRFELLVAIVKYRTVIKKIRQGVCTRYLASLAAGSTLNVVLRTDGRFSAKKQRHTRVTLGERPKLLIGAGTGIAPLRAIVYHDDEVSTVARERGTQIRTCTDNSQAEVPTTLIFGCRSPSADFFFSDEWHSRLTHSHSSLALASEATIATQTTPSPFNLITAFSRPLPSDPTQPSTSPKKAYIQDRIVAAENRAHVFDMLVHRAAVVVVCGSSGAMPRGVREACLDVLEGGFRDEDGGRDGDQRVGISAGNGNGGEEEGGETARARARVRAEMYLEQMEREGRYLQETW